MVMCLLLLAMVAFPTSAIAQAASPAGIQLPRAWQLEQSMAPTHILRGAQDATPRPSAAPYVLTGALIGALAGLMLYKNAVDAAQDGDFAFPFTLILPLSAGAIVGAYVGWVLRPMS